MLTGKRVVRCLLVLSVVCTASSVLAADYSAVINNYRHESRDKDGVPVGVTTTTDRLYVSGELSRTEHLTDGKAHRVHIYPADKDVSYELHPREKTYEVGGFSFDEPTEKPKNEVRKRTELDSKRLEYPKLKLVGKGNICGQHCDKYEYSWITSPAIERRVKKPLKCSLRLWYSKDLDTILREDHLVEGKLWKGREYKSIKLGKQPKSLFEVPTGYRKVDD